MNNAVTRRLYNDQPVKLLAPVIPIKPTKKVKEKITQTVAVKTDVVAEAPAPAFAPPVFKPKKHDMF